MRRRYAIVYGGGALADAALGVVWWVTTGDALLGAFFLLLGAASLGAYFLVTQPSRLRERRAAERAAGVTAQPTTWRPARRSGRSAATAPSDDPAGSGQVVVRRPRGYAYAVMRRVRITVDGRDVGGVRPGEELCVPVPAGRHTVRARMDWTGSPDVPVEIGPGERVVLDVEPAGDLLTGLVSKDRALTLTPPG